MRKWEKVLRVIAIHDLLQTVAIKGVAVVQVGPNKFVSYDGINEVVADVLKNHAADREVLEDARQFAKHPVQVNKIYSLLRS